MSLPPRHAAVALHHRIADALEAAIKSGDLKPGDRIPTESALTLQYQCSRMTVSKAVSALVTKGMVVRKRKAGSFVATPALDLAVLQIEAISDDVHRAGDVYGFTLLSRDISVLDPDEADRFHEMPGEPILRLTCMHFANGRPHALEKRIVILRAVPRVRHEMFLEKSPGAWLLAEVPWSKARHLIRAVSADGTIARTMKIKKGTACLMLTRQTWQNNRTVTYAEMLYAGERYQFAGEFEP